MQFWNKSCIILLVFKSMKKRCIDIKYQILHQKGNYFLVLCTHRASTTAQPLPALQPISLPTLYHSKQFAYFIHHSCWKLRNITKEFIKNLHLHFKSLKAFSIKRSIYLILNKTKPRSLLKRNNFMRVSFSFQLAKSEINGRKGSSTQPLTTGWSKIKVC